MPYMNIHVETTAMIFGRSIVSL